MSFPTDDPSQLSFETDIPSDADSEGAGRRNPRTNAATGASAAGVRAISAQAVAFYFRAPVKAFFRTRVERWKLVMEDDYSRVAGPRSPHIWLDLYSISGVTAVNGECHILSNLHGPTLVATKRIYPPPSPVDTFMAGFAAGTIQSVIAAPLDAIQARFRSDELLNGQHRSAWHYWKSKLSELGMRGIFSGWTLSFLKDSCGSALFFCLFETIKSQGYYSFVTRYYGSLQPRVVEKLSTSASYPGDIPVIRPHYALEPCFLMLAGVTASIGQQVVLHPLGLLQSVYYKRLEHLDGKLSQNQSNRDLMRVRFNAYQDTFERCRRKAQRVGGWRAWLYRGFLWNTLRQVPSTSTGLVIFELVRRKYGLPTEAVHIKKDGYDILLT
ncbi:conserved hypothetical protein [Uncinocarpus reesii 1704]|uniref:Mitochondrial carrier protein n=1 Tax=Uncinocarpus reesii (strain UAMH 1704) TaxID=336963 RepID=C4JPK6_UNCRE|nr:uncharacterized protein UREG_03178 [Uncinocarpus reesii 1704]EEP78332.1 conserved hypothetical protein [Uncinocarpus reesii 1704]